MPFPFSDLSQAKLRPAVALAPVDRGDWILCQITSNPYGDTRSIALPETSFATGSLRLTSYARTREVIHGKSGPDYGTSRYLKARTIHADY